ncbi:hypothetical protein AB205_0220740 [Aquarana catesbeiana]|uniref:IF rod domain-containing protein n=1 Tax=Aquarana catesbeiana TaxID=8400 RepID=A0A2G9S3W4_AQUCT|nr:hypothetical protein AB205_0220740 [Aquarana catesbeiana]
MRFLNDRLATYLEKVRSLEKENANLEKKIRDWYDKNHPQMLPDFSHYFAEMEELQRKKVNSLYSQLGARVTVEVEAPQSADLSKILSEIREQYEDLMESNKAEAEKWFLAKKMALESTIIEKKGSYSSQLSQLQQLINQVEGNLSQVRDKQERQNEDYKALMHVTTHLEREIATYQLLLEKQDIRFGVEMD